MMSISALLSASSPPPTSLPPMKFLHQQYQQPTQPQIKQLLPNIVSFHNLVASQKSASPSREIQSHTTPTTKKDRDTTNNNKLTTLRMKDNRTSEHETYLRHPQQQPQFTLLTSNYTLTKPTPIPATTATTPTPIVKTSAATIVVFVNQVKIEGLTTTFCPVHLEHVSQANLWFISNKLETNFSIPQQNQTITLLVSPVPRVYSMQCITEFEARSISIPLTASLLVTSPTTTTTTISSSASSSPTPSSPFDQVSQSPPLQSPPPPQQQQQNRGLNTFPLRSGRQLKAGLINSSPSYEETVLNETRSRLTEVLCDIRKHVSLDMIARMTNRSKSSLSLWRRGLYRGNNILIAKAVTQAMQELQRNNWKYVAELHNGCIPFER